MNVETVTRSEVRASRKKKIVTEIAIVIGVGLILAVLLPLISALMPLRLPAFRLQILGKFLSLAIVALGIDLIWGYTGLLSLGHGIFFALGGYALAMYLNLQLPAGQLPEFFTLYGVTELPLIWKPFYSLPVTILAILIVPAIVAGLLGYLIFRNRIKGVYFSILTQAALLVFFNFFNGQQKLINGTNGLKTGTEKIFGMLVSSDPVQRGFYLITIVCLGLVYLLCRWLTSGRFGRLLVAIRDDEIRVRFSGYDPTWFKVLVFAISGSIAGVSGALYTVQAGIINPNIMDVSFSIEMVIWVAVGGRATLVGAIIGTLLVQWARTFLSEQFSENWVFFQGALFLIVVTVLPKGILGGLQELRSRFGYREPLIAYPEIDVDSEVQREKEELGQK